MNISQWSYFLLDRNSHKSLFFFPIKQMNPWRNNKTYTHVCFYFSFTKPFCSENLRGDWPVKFWSQNVPEQVFVFFQVWVPKHAYFSSKSVFLWYMFDFYANENILWTLVCLFLSCGRPFHWKNTPFHPLVTGTFYPKLSTCCLSKCSVASDLQNDVMTQWELPLMKAQRVWKGGKGIPTETS